MNITFPVDQQLTSDDLYGIVGRTIPLFYERKIVDTIYRGVLAENFCICSSIDVIYHALKKDRIIRGSKRNYTHSCGNLIVEWRYDDTETLYTIHGLTPDQHEKLVKDFDLRSRPPIQC